MNPQLALIRSAGARCGNISARCGAERGTTIFLTTHYLDEAEDADQICIINHGSIVASGSPEQVKSQLTETYLLINAEDRSQLRGELRRLKIRVYRNIIFQNQSTWHRSSENHQGYRNSV